MNNPQEVRTQAIVLRRTDYGEADRILQLLTPLGKQSVVAKGVRREKSKLAGGIELFSVSNVMIHQGGRSNLGILTGARLLEYFDAFARDIELVELGGAMMKRVNRRAEQVDAPEFFVILRQAFQAIQARAGGAGGSASGGGASGGRGAESATGDGTATRWRELLWVWFMVRLAEAGGEEVNLSLDVTGEKLTADGRYFWNEEEAAFERATNGRFGAEHIKLLRVLATVSASQALKIRQADALLDEALYVARCLDR